MAIGGDGATAVVDAARRDVLTYRWDRARRALEEAVDGEGTAEGAPAAALSAWVSALAGHATLAEQRAAQATAALRPLRPRGDDPQAACRLRAAKAEARLALAEVALQRDDLAAAGAVAAGVVALLDAHPDWPHVAAARMIEAAVALRVGDPLGALAALDRTALPVPGALHARLLGLRTRALLRAAPLGRPLPVLDGLPLGPDTVLAHAEVAAARRDQLAGDRVLRWRAPDWPAVQVASLVARGIVTAAADRTRDAGLLFDQALVAAAPERLWGALAGLPAHLRPIVERRASARRFLAEITEPRPAHRRPRAQLTDREVAVLQGLAGDGALREVADRLGISVNTLKSHTRHLYEKLEVSSRAEACAAARRMGLIDPLEPIDGA